MTYLSSKAVRFLLLILLCQVLVVSAQEKEDESDCKAHEVDMGDYCASLSPALTEEEQSRRRVTRFRGKSMMPGRTNDVPAEPEVSKQPEPVTERFTEDSRPVVADTMPPAEPAVPAVISGPATVYAIPDVGYVVQLGAFSTRTTAESVARDVNSEGIPVGLARLEIGGKSLWASFAGPYEHMEEAKTARNLLRQRHGFAAAWIKPAKDLSLIGIVDETIEE